MKNVTFEELPGERFCPPERIYYIESHLFILEKKFLIILFSSVFLFWFGGASRLSPRRDFPCNRAVCLSPLLPALLLGVSARLLLVVMRERKWRREKRVKQRRTFRHWQPRRGTVWSGSTGRNSRPMHSHKRTVRNFILFFSLHVEIVFWAPLQVILSRLCCLLACSSLFGFQKLHEDGARTKALLIKVANLTGCILQPSSTLIHWTYSSFLTTMHDSEFALKVARQSKCKWPSWWGDQGQLAAAQSASLLVG